MLQTISKSDESEIRSGHVRSLASQFDNYKTLPSTSKTQETIKNSNSEHNLNAHTQRPSIKPPPPPPKPPKSSTTKIYPRPKQAPPPLPTNDYSIYDIRFSTLPRKKADNPPKCRHRTMEIFNNTLLISGDQVQLDGRVYQSVLESNYNQHCDSTEDHHRQYAYAEEVPQLPTRHPSNKPPPPPLPPKKNRNALSPRPPAISIPDTPVAQIKRNVVDTDPDCNIYEDIDQFLMHLPQVSVCECVSVCVCVCVRGR
jgi:hypothetical protein